MGAVFVGISGLWNALGLALSLGGLCVLFYLVQHRQERRPIYYVLAGALYALGIAFLKK